MNFIHVRLSGGRMTASLDQLPGPTHLPGGCHPSGKDYEQHAGIESPEPDEPPFEADDALLEARQIKAEQTSENGPLDDEIDGSEEARDAER